MDYPLDANDTINGISQFTITDLDCVVADQQSIGGSGVGGGVASQSDLMNSAKINSSFGNSNQDHDDFIFSGIANNNITTKLECTSEQLIDSIIRMPTPPQSPILTSASSSSMPTTTTTSPTLSSSSSAFSNPIPAFSLSSTPNQNTQSTPTTSTPTPLSNTNSPPPFRTTRRPSSHMKFIISRFDPIISIDNKRSYENYRAASSAEAAEQRQFESVVECIQIAYEEKKLIKQDVIMNNLVTKQQYRAIMNVVAFSDGCSCIFESIEEVIDEPEYVKQQQNQQYLNSNGIITSPTLKSIQPTIFEDKQLFNSTLYERCQPIIWISFTGSTCPIRTIFSIIIGWVGISHSYLMNEGSIVSVKSQVNLDSMYNNFKELYEQQQSKSVLSLDLDNISSGSFESMIEQKKIVLAEEHLKTFQKCRDTYNILFRLSLLGVMFSTLKGLVMDANDALLSIIGYSRQDLEQGKVDWMLITPPEYFEISARALQELKAKRWCQPIEKAYFHKNGKKVPILITAAMVDGSDEQCITFVFDLSRYRQAEESAIKATKLKSQFIANISHELRTPCHGILGMTQLLLDSGLTPNQRDSAETIKRSIDGLINLINDILDFSKIEAGKLTLEIVEFELISIVEEVLNLQGELANKKGIDLIFIIGRQSPVPPMLYGDSRFIRQVLINLVHNALKFTESGHVVLEISTEYESGDQVSLRFSVKDTGIGIPDSVSEQLFQPFSQVDGSSSRKYGGTGLGLSICRDLVGLMGGNISYESKVGKGSCFWFSLKLLVAAPAYLPSSVPAANQFFFPEFNQFSKDRKKILVVEANQKLRMSFHSMLSTVQFESIETNNMETALNLFNHAKTTDAPFDALIISDQSTAIKSMLDQVTTERVIIYGRDYKSSWSAHPQIASYLLKPIRYTKLIHSITRRLSNASSATISSGSSGSSILKIDDPMGVAIERKDKRCILVAEDNDVNIKVIVRQLDKLGYYPIVGCNGRKVLEILTNTQECQFSLILMDVQMPSMDGFTCSRVIRELEPKHQRIPIIAMTANSKPSAEEQCKMAGMDDYLAKPVKIDSLKSTLLKWLPKEEPKHFFYPLNESQAFVNHIDNETLENNKDK
ncbi:histidine kinase [Heterostelium album PN500]|uniref:histidine kinase n=1 Tax=Heterostelium pallidum (strain ATCC 26659 / Pp 5 / PN500) TaxID=670386 RepID=D3B7E7_HETP5|nr:histidine kinase [Heterostelium album PN500]EFA82690.1 histidine kinase [Heterostelium album PN500]|eukprot:XP_020434807.1 histidine kinase [Heterostelium album PN500]